MRITKNKDWALEDYLSEEQKEDWHKHFQFIVIASDDRVFMLGDGQRVYQLRNGEPWQVYNVWAIESEEDQGFAPERVSLLTQLLFLQSDPYGLLCHACNDGYSEPIICAHVPPMTGYFVKGSKDARAKTKRLDKGGYE